MQVLTIPLNDPALSVALQAYHAAATELGADQAYLRELQAVIDGLGPDRSQPPHDVRLGDVPYTKVKLRKVAP